MPKKTFALALALALALTPGFTAAPTRAYAESADDNAVVFESLPSKEEIERYADEAASGVSLLADSSVDIHAIEPVTIPAHNPVENLDIDRDPAAPFAPETYYVRSLLSEEGQKAWDLALEQLLAYDNSDGSYSVNGSGDAWLIVDYAAAGIHPTKEECAKIQDYLRSNVFDMADGRLFHLKNWPASFDKVEGDIVVRQKFGIGNGYAEGDKYQKELVLIEETASNLLRENCKSDMTILQQVHAVKDAYEAMLTYDINAPRQNSIMGSMIDKHAVCGGYSLGWLYMLQHMGITSIYVQGIAGGEHAWNYAQFDGKWFLFDTTWGGDNWWFSGQNWAGQNHFPHDWKPYQIPELVPGRISFSYGRYPSLTISAMDDQVVLRGDDFDPASVVTGWTSIYGEDLADRVEVRVEGPTVPTAPGGGETEEIATAFGNVLAAAVDNAAATVGVEGRATDALDTQNVGEYTLTAMVSDDHGNTASAQTKVTVAAGDVTAFDPVPTKNFTLLQDGKEVSHASGYYFTDKNPDRMILELSDAQYDQRVFEATAGIVGTVRTNPWGYSAKVAFTVECLKEMGDGSYKVLSTYTTPEYKREAEAVNLHVEIPDDATHVRIISESRGNGNDHTGWTNVRVTGHDVPVMPEVTLEQGDAAYTGEPIAAPKVATGGSEGAVSLVWERKAENGWEALEGAPVEAGAYSVAARVASAGKYMAASSEPVEFSISPRDAEEHVSVPQLSSADEVAGAVLTDGDRKLVEGVDYDVETTSDGETVTVTFTFKGNYAGTVVRTFAAQVGGVTIDEVNFPDANFRAWLLNAENHKPKSDKDEGNPELLAAIEDGVLTEKELGRITSLAPKGQGIRDFTGIEHFTSLIYLNAELNYATSIDLSPMTELRNVYLRHNLLTSIDFSHNTKLEFIEIFDNQLTSIDVSMLPNLRFVHLDYNQLVDVDLSHNTNLEMSGFVLNNNPTLEHIKLPVIKDKSGAYQQWDTFNISEMDELTGYSDSTWYTDEACTQELEVGHNIMADFAGQDLYAKRTPNPYTVVFRPGAGASGSVASIDAVWGEEFAMPEADGFERTGYAFAGWELPNTRVVQPGERAVWNLAGKNADSTMAEVTATWKPVSYTLRFVSDSDAGAAERGYDAVYDQGFALPEVSEVAPDGYTDHVFNGWQLPDGSVMQPGETVRNLASEQGAVVELRAQWAESDLGALKRELIEDIARINEGMQDSDGYLEGVKAAAQALADDVSTIKKATTVEGAQDAYAAIASALAALPTLDEVHTGFDAALGERDDLPSAIGDVTTENVEAAHAAAKAWAQPEPLLADAAAAYLRDSAPAGVTYTEADARTVAAWAAEGSATVRREQAYAQALAAALTVFDAQSELAARPFAQVGSGDVAAFEEALATATGLDDHTMLASHIAELSERVDLAREKLAARERVEREFAALTSEEGRYSAKGIESLESIRDEALAAIEGAESGEAAVEAVECAMSDMGEVPTHAEEDAAALAAAKERALSELDAVYGELSADRDRYSDEAWAAVEEAYGDARATIEGADDVDGVDAALERGVEAMRSVKQDVNDGQGDGSEDAGADTGDGDETPGGSDEGSGGSGGVPGAQGAAGTDGGANAMPVTGDMSAFVAAGVALVAVAALAVAFVLRRKK